MDDACQLIRRYPEMMWTVIVLMSSLQRKLRADDIPMKNYESLVQE